MDDPWYFPPLVRSPCSSPPLPFPRPKVFSSSIRRFPILTGLSLLLTLNNAISLSLPPTLNPQPSYLSFHRAPPATSSAPAHSPVLFMRLTYFLAQRVRCSFRPPYVSEPVGKYISMLPRDPFKFIHTTTANE